LVVDPEDSFLTIWIFGNIKDGNNSGLRQPSRRPGFDNQTLPVFLFCIGFQT
jgi:hypothetical protein